MEIHTRNYAVTMATGKHTRTTRVRVTREGPFTFWYILWTNTTGYVY